MRGYLPYESKGQIESRPYGQRGLRKLMTPIVLGETAHNEDASGLKIKANSLTLFLVLKNKASFGT